MASRKLGSKLEFCALFFLLIARLKCSENAFTPVDNYLIDCGSLTDTKVGGRVFVADTGHSWTLTTPKDTVTSISDLSSVLSLPSSSLYLNARVFTEPSSYSFPIQQQGRHFIRLYFFPFDSKQFNLTAAQFSVSIQDFSLLTNFHPRPAFKEFSAYINQDTLILSFFPAKDSVAFVSALEVVSVPDSLIAGNPRVVNKAAQHDLLSLVLETVYRLNMGGPKVSADNDPLWRNWGPDGVFLVDPSLAKNVTYSSIITYAPGAATPEIAPAIVYRTATRLAVQNFSFDARFNVTWSFEIDSGSNYLVRMHFCDIVSIALNILYFNAYINTWSASTDIDLSTMSLNSLHTALYIDFVVEIPPETRNLAVSIGPSNLNDIQPDGILNGLEIMKIGGSGSGAVVKHGSKGHNGAILGAVFGVLVLVTAAAVGCLVSRRKKVKKQHSKTAAAFGNAGYRFSFALLREATNNFDESWVIGKGGFGKVYKGVLRDETKAAIKRRNPMSRQGHIEFLAEIHQLSQLRHRHLVSLIGYCDEGNEMILVYEYMEKGTLKSHLYGSESDLHNLSWEQRLKICIGAARGLHYLHSGTTKAIIHCDVKSANILLDDNLMAKVADFGLSKTGPELEETNVSSTLKGTIGYLDPEYCRKLQLTEKSDVYSFGVVLLEVLCARPAINQELPREMVNLAEWGLRWKKRRDLDQIVDARIAGTIKPDSLRTFGETVERCLSELGMKRPTMGEVVFDLEYALRLQEAESPDSEVNSMNEIAELSFRVQNVKSLGSFAGGRMADTRLQDLSGASMSGVSLLVKPEGR